MAFAEVPLLDEWRQGDLFLAPVELPAVVLDGEELAWQGIDAAHGVILISQSCDIIRDVEHRPFVHVAALVLATDEEIARAIRRETPSRVHLECIVDQHLLIDLDVTATIHKSVVATWLRTPGCQSDDERRRIAAALARFRQRFAFPDDFNALVQPIRKWIESKRSKQSAQGNFVRAMNEVRVRCADWENPAEITFYVMVNAMPEAAEMADWLAAAKTLEQKAAAAKGRYPSPEFQIVRYDDLSAGEYLMTDRLDWEGLSDAS